MASLRKLISAAAVGILPLYAAAFEINPHHSPETIKRTLKSEYLRYLSKLALPTHEDITKLALQCAESKITVEWCDLEASDLAAAKTFDKAAVELGSRWNDDPNNFFRVGQEVIWLYWLKDADFNKKPIKNIDPLEYRSHYGDLQFLHGMGSEAVPPTRTQGNIVDWVHFAYEVATGQIPPTATLKSLEQSHAFANFFAGTSKREWTVKKLFTNVGDIKCRNCKDLSASTEELASLALGALLHTIQDSFSTSHVERVLQDGDSKYRVVAWLDYRKQKAHCHGEADKDIAWIISDEPHKPAISWGAWIVRNAMLKVSWNGVEDSVRSRMFAMASPYRSSYGGEYSECEATSSR